MRILWLKTELLHPVDRGGRIRTYHMLKELKRSHQITYLALDDGGSTSQAHDLASEYCHELVSVPHKVHKKFSPGFYAQLGLNLASSLPFFVQKYRSAEMRRKIVELIAKRRPDLMVCDFLMPSINVPPRIGCPSLLFQHNIEARIWRRHFDVETNRLRRVFLYDQWRKARRFEAISSRRFDCVVTVS